MAPAIRPRSAMKQRCVKQEALPALSLLISGDIQGGPSGRGKPPVEFYL